MDNFDPTLLQKQGNAWAYDGQVIQGFSANTPRSEVIAAIQSGSVQLPGVAQTARSGSTQAQAGGLTSSA